MQYEQPVTLPVTLVYLSIHITGQHPPVLAQGRQKGWIFENSIWIGCFSHAALFFLVSWRILLPARSWSCWWSDLVAYCTSLEDFGFLSSASVDFPTSHLCAHLKVLFTAEQFLFSGYVSVWVFFSSVLSLFWMLGAWWYFIQETWSGWHPWSLSPAFAYSRPTLPSSQCLLALCQA